MSERAVPAPHQLQHPGERPLHLSPGSTVELVQMVLVYEGMRAGELVPPLRCKRPISQGNAGELTLAVNWWTATTATTQAQNQWANIHSIYDLLEHVKGPVL